MRLPYEPVTRKMVARAILIVAFATLVAACGSTQEPQVEEAPTTSGERWSQIEGSGTGLPEEEEGPAWELTEDTEFNGRVLLINSSETAVTRIWFSPSDLDDFSLGYEWPETQRVDPGQTAAGPAVEGWWDVWLEAESGEDATVMRVWVKPNAITRFNVSEVWWETGDLLGRDLNLSHR